MSNVAGSGCDISFTPEERKELQEIEHSITTIHKKTLWARFIKAIKEFKLVADGDKVAVAVSGGKDSLVMAKLFQELQRHRRISFSLEFIAMDPGYHKNIRQLLVENCTWLNVPIHLFDTQIFSIADHIAQDYPCYLCARMRRGALYAKAQELGCNKLALGHHFNDVIETTMLSLIYTGCFKTMLPKLKSTNYAGLELIRPLYYVREEDIASFTAQSGIWPLNCACMVTAEKTGNKRYEMKKLIDHLKENYFVDADKSILKATQNVNMDCILGWQKDGKNYSYLDFYDEDFQPEN